MEKGNRWKDNVITKFVTYPIVAENGDLFSSIVELLSGAPLLDDTVDVVVMQLTC